MQKKLLSSILIFLFFNLLIKPFWVLGVDVGVQNAVGPEQYGLYSTIFNFSFLFNILLDLGITNFNNRNIAQNNQLVTKHFSGLISLKLVLAIVYVIITFLVGAIVGYSSIQFYLLAWMCLNQFLNSFIIYLRSNLSALLMFKMDSILSVLDKVLMVVFCGILLWGGGASKPFQIEWLVYSQTAAYIITASIAFVAVARKAHFRKLSWNFTFFLAIVKQTMPYAILVLLMAFYNRIDSVMVERILPVSEGNYQAGIYAGAFRLLDALNMVGYLVSIPLLPIFAKMLKNKEDIQKIAKIAFSFLFFVSVTVAISCAFYAGNLMDVLYKARGAVEVEQYTHVFKILIFCFIPFSMTYVFGTLLTANGNLKYLNLIALGGMILNISLNLLFIPHFKGVGAAFASITTQSATALVQIILAIYLFKFRRSYSYLVKLVCFIIGVILVSFLLKKTNINWAYSLGVVFISAFILSIILRLFQPRKILSILKQPSE